MNFRFQRLHVTVGVFLLISTTLLVMAGYFTASSKKLFARKVPFHTVLDRGDGISTTTSLTMRGIEIGAITDIYMNDEGKILVHFHVFPEFAGQLRGFTYVRISSTSLLGGKTVEIIPSATGNPVPPDSRLPTDRDPEVDDYLTRNDLKKPSDDTSQKINAILENVEAMTGNFRVLSAQFKQPDGNWQRSMANTEKLTADWAAISGALKDRTPEMQSMIVDAKRATEDAKQMVQSTKESGLFRALTPAPQPVSEVEHIMHLDSRNTQPPGVVP